MPDETEAAEAFGILADPTRVAILRAFAEALDEIELDAGGEMPLLSFSEVYDRVDVDSTSQLSYHLEKLDGTYLQHTDEGWKFTFAGEAIVRLFLSGAYAGGVEFDPIETEGSCPFCGTESLRLVVEDLVLFRECADCDRRIGGLSVTPAQVRDRDEESVQSSADTRVTTSFWQFREDVCSDCGGGVDVEFHDLSGEGVPYELVAAGRCRQCWRSLNGPPSVWLSNHPASVAFHWDHGVDVLSFGLHEMTERLANGDWRTDRVDLDDTSAATDRVDLDDTSAPTDRVDSGKYLITYRVDDAVLRLAIDDDLSVLGAERVRRDSAV